jgi:3-deoxy-manno-octulosonate cytidylyltransferase (CMP-KDO synthetase)
MRKIVVIPARLASTRLPNKLMLPYKGIPIVRHVLENAVGSRADYIFLASSDDELLNIAKGSYGANCFAMKTEECNNGTQRVVKAMRTFGLKADDLVINLQADNPQLTSDYINELFDILQQNQSGDIATFARETTHSAEPNVVKVVLDENNMAMYFSRSQIPYGSKVCLEHIGIYGFRKRFFDEYDKIMNMGFGLENLEQLAWMYNGLKVIVSVVNYGGISVDTRDDYDLLDLT